jgi:hypothetical protein
MISLRRLAIAKNLTSQSLPGLTQAVELIGEVAGGVNWAFTQPCHGHDLMADWSRSRSGVAPVSSRTSLFIYR